MRLQIRRQEWAASALVGSGFTRWTRQRQQGQAAILTFHGLNATGAKDATLDSSLHEPVAVFRETCRHLSQHYDVLPLSADGPLLKDLYLDTLKGLSLDQGEGARLNVAEFAAEVTAVTPTANGFIAETGWSAMGTVGHWGHNHTRTNVNEAKVTVEPREGVWKITAIDITDQPRL